MLAGSGLAVTASVVPRFALARLALALDPSLANAGLGVEFVVEIPAITRVKSKTLNWVDDPFPFERATTAAEFSSELEDHPAGTSTACAVRPNSYCSPSRTPRELPWLHPSSAQACSRICLRVLTMILMSLFAIR